MSKSKISETISLSIIQQENKMEFVVKNERAETIYFISSGKLDIEKKIKGEWVQLRILPCPCDAPCRNSEQVIGVKSNETYVFDWNMMESWCGKENIAPMVRKTETQKVDYRIKFIVKRGNQINDIKREFNINY